MPYHFLDWRLFFVIRESELVCRHWYFLRRLFRQHGICRKCKVRLDRHTRKLMESIESQFRGG